MTMRITPDDVAQFSAPTDCFLCPLSANVYGLEFLKFTIRDMTSNTIVFDIEREPTEQMPTDLTPEMEAACRSIKYNFHRTFLQLQTVGAKLVFAVGPSALPNFRMIERHYFRDRLIKSFDFSFGFCIPNSTNSWEAIYDMPQLSAEEMEEIVAHPYETQSDSFYFVDDELIMHNKAYYAYVE